MPRDVCPKCKAPIEEYDYFFCSSCGTKLPSEMTKSPKPVKMRTYSVSQDKQQLSLSGVFDFFKNKTVMYVTGLLIVIGIVFVGIFNSGIFELAFVQFSNEDKVSIDLPAPRAPVKKELVTEREYITGKFGEAEFPAMVPSEVYLYFEGFDIAGISEYFVQNEDLAPLFSKSSLLLEDAFAGYFAYGMEEGWVYMFVPKDIELIEKVLEDMEGEEWAFKIFDNKLVMTTNPDIFEMLEKINNNIEPSLSLNSQFIKMRNELDPEGELQVYFMKSTAKELVRNSLGGLDQMTIAEINKAINSDFNSLVVK